MNRLKILEFVLYVAYLASLVWFMSRNDIPNKAKWRLRLIIVIVVAYEYVWLYNSWVICFINK